MAAELFKCRLVRGRRRPRRRQPLKGKGSISATLLMMPLTTYQKRDLDLKIFVMVEMSQFDHFALLNHFVKNCSVTLKQMKHSACTN